MNIVGWIFLVLLVLLAGFAAANWPALAALSPVSFLAFSADAPMGLILFGFALAFALVVLAYVATERRARHVEARRHAQEIRVQRAIADKAEESRIEALRLQVERDTAALRAELDHALNSLAASIGHVDDKLDRVLGSYGERIEPGVASRPRH
jgi:uncharacterized integral membrane protein